MATNKKYLSKEGLTHLVELIKNGTAAKDHTHDFSDLSGGIAHELSGEVIEQKLVNGNGSVGGLTVYGNTRQNLWVNPSGRAYGVTVTSNADGSVTLSGTSTQICNFEVRVYSIRPGTTYTMSIDKAVPGLTSGYGFYFDTVNAGAKYVGNVRYQTENTFVAPDDSAVVTLGFYIPAGVTVSGTYRVMLNEGSEAQPWCPPGLNGVEELSVMVGGECITGETHDVQQQYATAVDLPAPANECLKPGTEYMLCIHVLSGTWYFNEYLFSTSISYYGEGVFTIPVTTKGELPNTITCIKTKTADLCVIDYCYISEGGVTTPVDLDGHTLNSLPDGTRDELRIDGTGAVTLVQRVGVATAPTEASGWTFEATVPTRGHFDLPVQCVRLSDASNGMCDKLPMRLPGASAVTASYALAGNNFAYARNPAITSVATAATVAGGATYLYPLAAPQEVELPGIAMPSVNADSITVFAASNVPTELDATVIDLPVVPISSGGTGATTASGARTGLDVYSKAEVDAKVGDAIDLPLAVSKGGTGAVTSLAANYNLLNNATKRASNTVIEDDTNAAFFTEAPSTTVGALQKIPFLAVWNYIVAKIRSTFGFSSSNVLPVSHGGTGVTSVANIKKLLFPKENAPEPYAIPYFGSDSYEASYMLPTEVRSFIGAAASNHTHNYAGSSSAGGAANSANELVSHRLNQGDDLNDCKDDAAFYYSGGGNTVKNKPSGVEYFGMFVMRSADGYRTQILHGSDNVIYTRYWNASSWSSWVHYYSSANKPTPSGIGAAASSHDHSAANITSGTLPISRGGTGMTANPAMLVNLASASTANVFGSAPRPGVTGTLPVSHGGTGATAKGTTLLSNIGITISSSEAPATGTPGTIHIQLLD